MRIKLIHDVKQNMYFILLKHNGETRIQETFLTLVCAKTRYQKLKKSLKNELRLQAAILFPTLALYE